MAGMFLKCHPQIKDGREHRYWSVVDGAAAMAKLHGGKCFFVAGYNIDLG
jgi:hypothetical protein